MEKHDKKMYESQSVLGILFRQVKEQAKHKPKSQSEIVDCGKNVIDCKFLWENFNEEQMRSELKYVKIFYFIL